MTVQTTLKPVASYQSDYEAIVGILNDYFDGLFEGDVAKLRRIFHDDAWLKGNNYRKSLNEWLEAVANSPIPRDIYRSFGATGRRGNNRSFWVVKCIQGSNHNRSHRWNWTDGYRHMPCKKADS